MKQVDFDIHKGVNIGLWLSQSNILDERRLDIFNESDIRLIAESGFDHIRLPVDESQLFYEDMTLNESTVDLIHNTISSCLKYHLKVVFDYHVIRSHHLLDKAADLWRNPAEQDKLVEMWKVIQDQLRQYPVTDVAYEILNEAMAPNDEMWSNLMLRVVGMIRETEKDRVIVLGANRQNDVAHVKNIQPPQGDRNIILSFHFYEPLLLTHYQAFWTDLGNLNFNGEMQYPGQLIPEDVYAQLTDEEKGIVAPYNHSYDRQWILDTWKEAATVAKSKNLKLYLSEFGCRVNCGDTARYAWMKDIVSCAQESGIPYASWEYNDEFGFASRKNKGVIKDPNLLDILTK